MAANSTKTCFGLVAGNRGFFPDELAREGRASMMRLLKKLGYDCVVLNPRQTKFGCVETWEEAKKCAALFRENEDLIDGIIVTLPNFGDERGAADAIRMAGLNVPVLIHAWPDQIGKMTIAHRRDAFCGKMSLCNNLMQYGIPYSLTSQHTMDPSAAEFAGELHDFAAACRVVYGLGNCRIGALGARPAAFNTVRYSEKLLEDAGISVETLDLFDALGRAERLKPSDDRLKKKIRAIKGYVNTKGIPADAIKKMARLAVVMDQWIAEAELDATAVQCWTALEEFFGVVPCTVMSMLSETLCPSACEVDVGGAVAMYALALASQTPSALLDWNNNYGGDPDKCVCFHCSNLPKSCLQKPCMDYQEIIAGTVGKENTFGTIVGRIKPRPMTYARVSTFDTEATVAAYLGEGRFTADPLDTFGAYGVAEIPNLQGLLEHICRNGFEHHVAVSHSLCARAVHEALDTYLDWDVYWHQG